MERTELRRDVEAIQIPGGHTMTLEKGWDVVITQSLGGTYTVQVPPSDWVMTTSQDRKSTRLNSSHGYISYAVFCLKKKKNTVLPRPQAPPGARKFNPAFGLLPVPTHSRSPRATACVIEPIPTVCTCADSCVSHDAS